MNKFKLAEIMAIGNALEQVEKAIEAAQGEGNDYCEEALQASKEKLQKALGYAESCDRLED